MSRHRDVRCMNYSDEYDGYDDVYGHSVEDDYCVSPSAEQFMFNRNKQANMASFFTQPDIVEDNEEVEDIPSSYKLPKLSELDAAKLMSCVEAIKNVIGESYPESELNRKIIEFNFNTEAVLNSILNDETSKSYKDKLPVEKDFAEAQSGSETENAFSSNSRQMTSNRMDTKFKEKGNFIKDCKKSDTAQEFSSLSNMISKTSKPFKVESSSTNSSFNSLADLTAHHLKISEKKLNSPSGFTIPKINLNSPKSLPSKSDTTNFNSLADLTAHHLKLSTDNTRKMTIGSPSSFIIPKMTDKDTILNKSKISSSDTLANLAAHHLKISSEDKNSSLPPGVIIPKIDSKSFKSDKNPSFNSLAELSAHHLQSKKKVDSISGSVVPIDGARELSKSVLEKISNLNIEEKLVLDKVNRTGVEVPDWQRETHVKKEKLENINQKNTSCGSQSNKLLESTIATIRKECLLNNSYELSQKTVSLFGKVICKKYKRKLPYNKKGTEKIIEESTIIRFDFSSPSPDNMILSRLRLRKPT